MGTFDMEFQLDIYSTDDARTGELFRWRISRRYMPAITTSLQLLMRRAAKTCGNNRRNFSLANFTKKYCCRIATWLHKLTKCTVHSVWARKKNDELRKNHLDTCVINCNGDGGKQWVWVKGIIYIEHSLWRRLIGNAVTYLDRLSELEIGRKIAYVYHSGVNYIAW